MPAALKIQFRPLLTSGMICVPKTEGGSYLILIDSDASESEQTVTLWHELIHLLEMASGKSSGEDAVEKLAVEWAKRCPEILTLCRPAK